MISLYFCLIVSIILFIIALNGIINFSQHIITILMCIELMLLSISFMFLIFSVDLDDLTGQVMCLYVLGVAGAESAIGLGILVVYNRLCGVIMLDMMRMLKG